MLRAGLGCSKSVLVSTRRSFIVTSTQNAVVPAGQPLNAECAKEMEECNRKLDLTFRNTQEAFKSKSNSELFRAVMVLQTCEYDFLVQNNMRILNSLRATLGKNLFTKIRDTRRDELFSKVWSSHLQKDSLMKKTFYGHFVAGEDEVEVAPTVARLKQFGVKSILDYSVEADLTPKQAEQKTENAEVVTQSVTGKAITDTGVVDNTKLKETRERYAVHKEFSDRRQDVVSARTYFYEGEEECDRNRDIFCKTVDAVAEATGGEGFAAIKITALGRPALLLKLSESIAQTHNFFNALTCETMGTTSCRRLGQEEFVQKLKDFGVKTDSEEAVKWFKTVDFDADGLVDFHGWNKLLDEHKRLGEMFQVLNVKTGRLEPLVQNLTPEEEQEFANMVKRTIDVAEHAISKGVRIMVDAEQTYFQPAISRMAIQMMRKYNKDQGNIFNTYQAYLKNALVDMECDMQLARREGWHFGAKLVRGAYMEQERKRAKTVGYEDPINENFEATSQNYERCLTRIADECDRRGRDKVSVMAASHNENTVRFAVNLMKERGYAPSEKILCFAQLYGMCDQVSFSLGQAGFSVYKYLPYGPVEDVLPYLSRRALENGSLLKKANQERSLLIKEYRRRILSGQLFYKVPSN